MLNGVSGIWEVIGLMVGVLVVGEIARSIRVPSPILLVLAGFAVSFVPGVPGYEVNPDLVLFLLLPPLLYAAALESSVLAISKLRRPILGMAIGAVLVTAIAVALALHALVPAIPIAAALALGAVVAPPDAVATVAIARRAGLPRRLVTLLEGESLINDATSLILLKVAVAAIATGTLHLGTAATDFAWAAIGGVLIGVVVAAVVTFMRRNFADPLGLTVLSVLTPFLAYLVGEQLNVSGVLVVVVAGLILGYRSATDLTASVRLTESATWAAFRYALEGVVFGLIGLQLWGIVQSLETDSANLLLALVAVPAVVILIRPVWIAFGAWLRLITPGSDTVPPRAALAVVSWAGMRGVISLAAAQTLPRDTPMRPLILVCVITVIASTLILQGLTLPWLIRKLKIGGPDIAAEQAVRDAAQRTAVQAIHTHIDAMIGDGLDPERAERLRRITETRNWRSWLREDAEPETLRRHGRARSWQRTILDIERQVFLDLRNSGELSEETLREMQRDLDLEEALLDRDPARIESGHLDELHP